MKQRFSSLDVKVIAHELSSTLCDLRVANCYDLSSRIFLFKFHKPGRREQLIIDSGFRCHLTSFARTTASEPSAFVARLRKFLKTRRVTSVEQIGTDRVIEFTFSDGLYRLFLEFFAGGNIILCDKDLKVIALLRRVSSGAGEAEIKEGMNYSLETRQNFHGAPPLSLELLRSALQKHIEAAAKEATAKKAKRKQGDALRRALAASVPEFPPVLLEHSFKARHFDGAIPLEDLLKDDDKLQRLLDVLEEAKQLSGEIVATSPSKGYIIAKPAKQRPADKTNTGSDADKENVALVYEDFHPFRPKQFDDQAETTVIEIVGFNKAVDDFFSSLESQKLESRLTERELHAQRKIDAARQDHEKRIGGLQQVQELNVRKAQALEANLQRVEEATAAVNGLIGQGMDWEDIASLIKTEKARQNPVATIIKLPLKLDENTITLLLGEEELDDEDLDDESQSEASEDESDNDKENSSTNVAKESKLLAVDIDLALTGWANAGQYYDQKKTAADKENRTAQASGDALKRHEKKVQADLKKGLAQEKQVLRATRQPLWFEKFLYFISTEGYLVIGARDKSQSDILYQRHLGKDDVWIHAELEGASHIVVKNKPGLQGSPIPPSTLAQAGTFCVCSSSAWDSKAMMGAWWVKSDQVSKLAPNGDFLGPAFYEIKGQKQHLPPAQLLLGFGVMFKLGAASLAKRNRNRVPLGEVEPPQLQAQPDVDRRSTDFLPGQDTDTGTGEANSVDEREGEDSDGEAEDGQQSYSNPLQNGHDGLGAGLDNDKDEDHESNEDETGSEAPEAEQDDVGEEEEEKEPGLSTEHKAEDSASEAETVATTTTTTQGKITPQVRGKAGKKAKIKSKYAWQDEEDRALALRILGSAKGQEKRAVDEEEKAAKEAADAAAKERRREQHRIAQQKGKEAEESRQRRLAGESVEDEDESNETEDLAVLESYVGTPKPGDEIEDILVICAPWETMGPRFRWRTKVQPGTQKKGKAIREILAGWGRDISAREKKRLPPTEADTFEEEKMLRREGDLIKVIKDVEIVGCMPVKSCRVVMSGGGNSGKGGSKTKGGGGSRGGKGGAKGGRGGKGSKKK